ncbi:MAG: serine hydrolase domain-containing protein [Draconibacterium sp.]
MRYNKLIQLILWIFLLNGTSSAQVVAERQVVLPTGSTQQFVNDYFLALNSGSRKTLKDFLVKNTSKNLFAKIPFETFVTFNMAFYYETGGLGYEYLTTDTTGEKLIQLKLLNRLTKSQVTLEIPVSRENEIQVSGMTSIKNLETNNNGSHSQPISDKEIVEKLGKCVSQLEKEDEFSGVVLLSKNGDPIFKRAVGKANIAYEIPNKTDIKFNLASVGKIFTGLAIAQLQEQGKLKIDDTIDKYLTAGWLPAEISTKIQIGHLLTHTSGLGDYFTDIYKQCEIQTFRDLNDYNPLVFKSELCFEPGSRFQYSNTGYLLLGVIIESVSGEEYFQYLNNHIFIPSGMVNSGGFSKDEPVKNRATGYTKIWQNDDFTWTDHQGTRILKGCPSGGVYSTAEDLLLFDNALQNNKLLSPENTKQLFTGFPELNASFHSSCFFLSNNTAGQTASHQGDGSGVNCQFKKYVSQGYTAIVLSNYSAPSANIIANVIDRLILQSTEN